MRKFLVLTTAAVLVVLMGSSAQATIRDITDPPGDVVRGTRNDVDESNLLEPVSRAEGDIVFTRIQHTATAVVAYFRFRQLTVPKQYASFFFEFDGNNGTGVSTNINTRHGDPQGSSFAWGRQGDCAHSYRINYAGDSVWMRIARGCLKNLKYIRVQAHSDEVRIINVPDRQYRDYYDSPVLDGLNNYEQLWTSWTPWVVTG